MMQKSQDGLKTYVQYKYANFTEMIRNMREFFYNDFLYTYKLQL